ncbi:MAG: toxic anion resistance protein [Lachnospiraceae bacterium]|nr:toxic anion resistance protein [Lachnospiraceae bacterium]MBQ9562583.1 toxic anion resistance protein [Lachnospiraceae bacterium]MBQ9592927.1 toxic anion resistance protein [Lachnospiraceae bacterium]MBR0152754.1 toxic anion resistance protein [Lachnospiraceae bacterium]
MMQNTPAPTLTLDPFGETAAAEAQAQAEPEKPEVVKAEEIRLTPEEQAMVDEFAGKIDIHNSNMILQYGAGAQKKMADFSETTLNSVRTKDLGEVGDLLTNVVTELRQLDDKEDKGFFGNMFKKSGNKVATMKAKYDKAEVNVNKVSKELENHQITLMKDIAMLDKMYDLNVAYFKELTMYIAAGKKKLQEVRDVEIPALKKKAQETGNAEDAQAVNDLVGQCDRFEKKLYDLELTRNVSLQMAPQIRLIQNNDSMMSEKIQSTLVNTIPLWKSQMVLAIGVHDSTSAAAAQREVTNVTNELLKKNAETLKQATIDTAKESERGIVDIETLTQTNQTLISTLDEVLKIQTEGKQKRQAAEEELNRIETELKTKMLNMGQN